MRNLTIIAFLMATTSLASAAGNESFIGQIGDTNNALVGQNGGNNKQRHHSGRQEERRDDARRTTGWPRRPTRPARCQFGGYNGSIAIQDGGNNTQGTIQGGVGNFAVTTQKGRRPTARPTTPSTAAVRLPERFGRRPERTATTSRTRCRSVLATSRQRRRTTRPATPTRTRRPPRRSAGINGATGHPDRVAITTRTR